MDKPKHIPHPVDVQIGKNLRTLRNARGVSRARLGAGLSDPITQNSIMHYEKGRNRLSGSVIAECAGLLGYGIAEFFSGIEPAAIINRLADTLKEAQREYDGEQSEA